MTIIKNEDITAMRTLRDAGLSNMKIAAHLHLSRYQVYYHLKKQADIARFGPKVIVYKGRIRGRKPRIIKAFIIANPAATLQDILIACDLDVTRTTLSTYLKRVDMQARRARSRIVVSNINKQKRLEFCRSMLEKSDHYLNSICFSDETTVKSRPNGEIILFRSPKGSEWFSPTNGGGGKSVMFWGCASKTAYGPLVEVIGKNTAATYMTTLKDYLVPEMRASSGLFTSQQDNATIN